MAKLAVSTKSASLYCDPVRLWCHIVLSGVPGIASFAGEGIANVTYTNVGQYQITLSDRYPFLLGIYGGVECALNNVDNYLQLEGEAVNTAGGGVIDVRVKAGGGGSVDPAAGDSVWVVIDLGNKADTAM
jgi:hypothetical protein